LITGVMTAALLVGIYGINWFLSIDRFKQTSQGSMVDQVDIEDGEEEGKKGDNPDVGEVPEEMLNREIEAVADTAPPELTENLKELIEQTDFTDPALSQRNRGGQEGGAGGYGNKGTGIGKGGKKRGERWSIEWGSENSTGYKKKLDHFGIYIGAVRGGQLIGAARSFSAGRPEITTKVPELWFVHQERGRIDTDRGILKDAGVAVLPTDIVAQFFAKELQDQMEKIETDGGKKNVRDIKRTVFGIRPAGAAYELYVLDQQMN
jgi:hypothetical protein